MRPTNTSSEPAASSGVGYAWLAGSSTTTMPSRSISRSRSSSGDIGRVVSTQTASEWPVTTGTRTQVTRHAQVGQPTGSCASR